MKPELVGKLTALQTHLIAANDEAGLKLFGGVWEAIKHAEAGCTAANAVTRKVK